MISLCVVRRSTEKEEAVGLYMPMVCDYVPDFDEKDMKEAVKQASGVVRTLPVDNIYDVDSH